MPIGKRLVQRGLLTAEQFRQVTEEHHRSGRSVIDVIRRLNLMAEDELARVVAEFAGVTFVEIDPDTLEAEAIAAIGAQVAREKEVLPLKKRHDTLTIAMADPTDLATLDELGRKSGFHIEAVCATRSAILKAIGLCYGHSQDIQEVVQQGLQELAETTSMAARGGMIFRRMDTKEEKSAVVELVNRMLEEGVSKSAADIHIDPEEDIIRVRYRIDGVLRPGPMIPKKLMPQLVSRVKIMAHLDIAENRLPQDGAFVYSLGPKQVDVRVASFPTVQGEKLSLRLLEKEMLVRGLEELGMDEHLLNLFRDAIAKTKGLILVTGPTGAGKTTTLYSALTAMDLMTKNIVTLEDPVEYQLNRLHQCQISPKAGLTFSVALRSILRHNPDVVMLGEMRDPETAELAIRASLTGVLVLSTLHTNDAPGAIPRLLDLGVEPYLVSSSLVAVVAQRLVRRICPKCREPYRPDPAILRALGLEELEGRTLEHGAGCLSCGRTGYTGRLGIYEILVPNGQIRDLVSQHADGKKFHAAAVESGMRTMLLDGMAKVRAGLTTAEELFRVANE